MQGAKPLIWKISKTPSNSPGLWLAPRAAVHALLPEIWKSPASHGPWFLTPCREDPPYPTHPQLLSNHLEWHTNRGKHFLVCFNLGRCSAFTPGSTLLDLSWWAQGDHMGCWKLHLGRMLQGKQFTLLLSLPHELFFLLKEEVSKTVALWKHPSEIYNNGETKCWYLQSSFAVSFYSEEKVGC